MDELKWYDLYYRGDDYSKNYEINEMGMVRRKETQRMLQTCIKEKYGESKSYVTISVKGKGKKVYVGEASFLSKNISDGKLAVNDGFRDDLEKIRPY